jgi:hypothetical protein
MQKALSGTTVDVATAATIATANLEHTLGLEVDERL